MKHLSKILIFASLLVATSSFAQNFKFGHFNSREIVDLMDERDSAMVKLEKYSKDIQQQGESMQAEMQNKYRAYQQNQASWTAAVLQTKQKELQEMQARLEEFQQKAEQDYRELYQSLLQPVVARANEAISKVGKANGFTFLYDSATGSFPYFNADQMTDVTSLLKKELKISESKQPKKFGQASAQPNM